MQITETETIVCIDCDDTLCMWDNEFRQPHDGAIAFPDPYDNSINYLKVHQKHVDLIKKYKGRGFYIRVWSAAGYKWAESVVKTLGLEAYVDSIETKPIKYIDDLTGDYVLGTRVYLPYEK